MGDGDYILRLEAEGFEPFTATIHVRDGASIIQNISVRLSGLTQRIEVKEQAEPLSADSSGDSKLSEKQIASLPVVEENFKSLLRLTPGVVRTLDGKLNFRGASEDQSMLQVNDSKMTDPVTGSFSIPVPLDAVQSARVVQTPYSAENGGFSGGLTLVETVPPPESWKFGVRDLNVSLRGKNDHLVGVGRATPRVVFGGPVFKDKMSFSEVFEYDVIRDPVRGLAWPRNEIKKQGFNSYSTLQAILSPKQVVTVTLNVFPQRTQFANITALIPQTASSDYDRKGASVSLSDAYTFSSGALFRMALNYTRFDSNAHGQGNEAMLLTPDGWGGAPPASSRPPRSFSLLPELFLGATISGLAPTPRTAHLAAAVRHSQCACSAKTAVSPNRYNSPARDRLADPLRMWKSLSRTTGCSAIAWPRTSVDDSPARPWAARRPSRRASASRILRAKIAKPFSAPERAFSMTAFRCSRRILPGIRHASSVSSIQVVSLSEIRLLLRTST